MALLFHEPNKKRSSSILTTKREAGSFCSKKWNGVIQPNATLVKNEIRVASNIDFPRIWVGLQLKMG
jgi:hypothetical protein